MKKNNKHVILEDLYITDYAAEGRALARIDGKVIFVSGAVPGDRADVLVSRNKKDWAEGRVLRIREFSRDRETPFCRHFGTCGGCKWQMLPYAMQLKYKQQEAEQNLARISKVPLPGSLPIIGCADTVHYRNKLEFTFSSKRYLTDLPGHYAAVEDPEDPAGTLNPIDFPGSPEAPQRQTFWATPELASGGALGFHVPRIFDKVLDISECFLMDGVNNLIRNTVRSFALENKFSFYDTREHKGWLRNLIIRQCTTGELMVNVCLGHEEEKDREMLFGHLLKAVPAITTLLYTLNPKWNDSIYDLTPQVYHGKGYVMEKLGNFQFKVSPKSFFQTNTRQAEKLYEVARDFAGLTGREVVYDLYCGTGSIGIFLSPLARKVIGVELIGEAIADARENAILNRVGHAQFFTGDVTGVCNDEFFDAHGRPDVIITDPPRAGMHEKLVNKLLEIAAPSIVYVSCNTATQARDIGLLAEKYSVEKIQPVDMFPHTHHIECVALLKLK